MVLGAEEEDVKDVPHDESREHPWRVTGLEWDEKLKGTRLFKQLCGKSAIHNGDCHVQKCGLW